MPEIKPNLKTKFEDFSGAEKAKLSTQGLTLTIKSIEHLANLHHQLRDPTFEEISDIAETLTKSCGIYLEFDRAKTGEPKDWMYMLRICIPGGGPITKKQWEILDDVTDRYCTSDRYTGISKPSLRVTTRQNIQMHWVKKQNLVDAIQTIAKSGFYTLNGCGDNTRNVMACPLAQFSGIYDANAWARKVGKYFVLPTASYMEIFEIDPKYMRDLNERRPEERFDYGTNLLNRKFKIGFSAIHYDEQTKKYLPDNCIELLTDDIGIAPVLEDGKVSRFQVYIGGSQGERNGYPTFAALGVPFGVFDEPDLMNGLDAIVKVHKEWGDRQNRHWARLKYVIYKMGIEWYRQQVRSYGADFDAPIENFDYGDRNLHEGWIKLPSNGFWAYGAFIENGRIIDGPNGQLKSMIRYLMENYPVVLFTTPNQDLIFSNIPEEEKVRFEKDMKKFGYGLRNNKPYSKLRLLSGACVGRDTCRLTYTDSEKLEPLLIDELEAKWGSLPESIGITGCERQCFRPATKTIGWVGSGFNLYTLKIGGTEDARNQGQPLVDPDTMEIYLRNVPKNEVAKVTDALFEFYSANKLSGEDRDGGMGYFFRRVGIKKIIEYLKSNPKTTHLMKPMKSPLPPRKSSTAIEPF
ncbi:MAG: nitrite/sulfite reductase [Thaumarchaeota archaeon]|nr:nitrite/sulfite reductase [Nitrososphaerota archaeon]